MGIAPTHASSLPETTHRSSRKWSGSAIIGITFVCLISTLSIRFYAEPRLTTGTFIDQDLRSPKTLEVTDIEATKQAQELAKQQVVPVYRTNPENDTKSGAHLEELLRVGDQLRISSGNLPYVDRKILSDETQRYLRRISDLEWQQLQEKANTLTSFSNKDLNKEQEIASLALAELALYKNAASPDNYQKLLNKITEVRSAYAQTQVKAATGPEMYRDRLLEMTNEEWETNKNLIRQALNNLQASGIVVGLPANMLQKRITNLKNLPTNEDHRAMAIALLVATVQPNLTVDYLGTTERVIKASESVQKQTISIKTGELIVKGGEKITERQFVILDELKMTQRQFNFNGLLLMVGTTAIAFGIFGYANRRWQYLLKVKLHNKDLLSLGIICTGNVLASVLMVPNMLVFVPLASMGLIIGSFYSSRLAVLITCLTSSLLAIAISINWCNCGGGDYQSSLDAIASGGDRFISGASPSADICSDRHHCWYNTTCFNSDYGFAICIRRTNFGDRGIRRNPLPRAYFLRPDPFPFSRTCQPRSPTFTALSYRNPWHFSTYFICRQSR